MVEEEWRGAEVSWRSGEDGRARKKVTAAGEVAASDTGREEAEGSGLQLLAPVGADDDRCGRPGASRTKGGGGTRLRWDLTRLEKELQLRRASRATGAGTGAPWGSGAGAPLLCEACEWRRDEGTRERRVVGPRVRETGGLRG